MSFTEFGGRSAAAVPEHNRLRGVEHTTSRPSGMADPHPSKADAGHTHDSRYPLGVLGRGSDSTDQAISTSYAALVTASSTVGSGRLVKVSFRFLLDGDGTAGQAFILRVERDSADIGRAWQLNNSGTENNIFTASGFFLDTPSAGIFTYGIAAATSAGAATTKGTAIKSLLLVEDIGAA